MQVGIVMYLNVYYINSDSSESYAAFLQSFLQAKSKQSKLKYKCSFH